MNNILRLSCFHGMIGLEIFQLSLYMLCVVVENCSIDAQKEFVLMFGESDFGKLSSFIVCSIFVL